MVLLALAFTYGVGVGKREWFPHDLIKKIKYLASNTSAVASNTSAVASNTSAVASNTSAVKFDSFWRLTYSSAHTEVSCPKQNENVGVIVAFGQSNSANHAEYKFSTAELSGVINYYDGRCYLAESPLLGATGADGEWIALTAKKLIDEGVYEKVIVVSSGIGGTPIERWADGNDLNSMLLEVLQTLRNDYRVTDMVWHQGESDRSDTHTEVYETYFLSMLNSIKAVGINAPVFVSIASICGAEGSWTYPNGVSDAQKRLIEVEGLELGVNTDEAVPIQLRYDKCHFGKAGQELAASELANSIVTFHTTK